MPVEALRSVEEHFDRVVRHVQPKRLVAEIQVADKGFYFRNFKGYRPEKIGRGRIKKVARKEIFQGDGNELFANLLIVHWNEARAQLYREMVAHVQAIDEDVESIEHIEDEAAHRIIDDLLERHDREDIYLCVRLNGVRFGEDLVQSRLVRGEPAPEPGEASSGEGGEGDGETPADESAEGSGQE
ncbi:MAG: hypothetical protein ACQEXJ_07830 [Myxococcota bacterium]